MRQLDLTLLVGGFVLRTALYAGLYAIGCSWDFGPSMLAGLLAGDLVGGIAALAFEWRRRGAAAVVELVLVAAFASWWWTRSGAPARADFQAIAVLAAFGAFALRTGASATRRFGPGDESSN